MKPSTLTVIVSEKVRMLYQERGIQVNYGRVLQSIDPGRRLATFKTAEGSEEQPYDFIHVIPCVCVTRPYANTVKTSLVLMQL